VRCCVCRRCLTSVNYTMCCLPHVACVCVLQESNGEVLRLPLMSKKMTMSGELEVTGSVAAGPQASQVSDQAQHGTCTWNVIMVLGLG
jgi:hypothetical protein